MGFGSGLAVYFVIWWLTIFMVLPIGVVSQREAGQVSPGSDPGAPAKTAFLKIVIINSVVAGVFFLAFRLFVVPNL
jgi:predicted secreted protein